MQPPSIIIRPRNSYETVGDNKVVYSNKLKQLKVAYKADTSKTKLHVNCKHGFGLGTRGNFVPFDAVDNNSILLDKDNDSEKEIIHFKFETKQKQSGSKYIHNTG